MHFTLLLEHLGCRVHHDLETESWILYHETQKYWQPDWPNAEKMDCWISVADLENFNLNGKLPTVYYVHSATHVLDEEHLQCLKQLRVPTPIKLRVRKEVEQPSLAVEPTLLKYSVPVAPELESGQQVIENFFFTAANYVCEITNRVPTAFDYGFVLDLNDMSLYNHSHLLGLIHFCFLNLQEGRPAFDTQVVRDTYADDDAMRHLSCRLLPCTYSFSSEYYGDSVEQLIHNLVDYIVTSYGNMFFMMGDTELVKKQYCPTSNLCKLAHVTKTDMDTYFRQTIVTVTKFKPTIKGVTKIGNKRRKVSEVNSDDSGSTIQECTQNSLTFAKVFLKSTWLKRYDKIAFVLTPLLEHVKEDWTNMSPERKAQFERQFAANNVYDLMYDPSRLSNRNIYNTFQGYPHIDLSKGKEDLEAHTQDIQFWLEYTYEIVCRSNKELLKGFLWLSQASLLGVKREAAFAFLGQPGCLKSTFAHILLKLVGNQCGFATKFPSFCSNVNTWNTNSLNRTLTVVDEVKNTNGIKDEIMCHINDMISNEIIEKKERFKTEEDVAFRTNFIFIFDNYAVFGAPKTNSKTYTSAPRRILYYAFADDQLWANEKMDSMIQHMMHILNTPSFHNALFYFLVKGLGSSLLKSDTNTMVASVHANTAADLKELITGHTVTRWLQACLNARTYLSPIVRKCIDGQLVDTYEPHLWDYVLDDKQELSHVYDADQNRIYYHVMKKQNPDVEPNSKPEWHSLTTIEQLYSYYKYWFMMDRTKMQVKVDESKVGVAAESPVTFMLYLKYFFGPMFLPDKSDHLAIGSDGIVQDTYRHMPTYDMARKLFENKTKLKLTVEKTTVASMFTKKAKAQQREQEDGQFTTNLLVKTPNVKDILGNTVDSCIFENVDCKIEYTKKYEGAYGNGIRFELKSGQGE